MSQQDSYYKNPRQGSGNSGSSGRRQVSHYETDESLYAQTNGSYSKNAGYPVHDNRVVNQRSDENSRRRDYSEHTSRRSVGSKESYARIKEERARNGSHSSASEDSFSANPAQRSRNANSRNSNTRSTNQTQRDRSAVNQAQSTRSTARDAASPSSSRRRVSSEDARASRHDNDDVLSPEQLAQMREAEIQKPNRDHSARGSRDSSRDASRGAQKPRQRQSSRASDTQEKSESPRSSQNGRSSRNASSYSRSNYTGEAAQNRDRHISDLNGNALQRTRRRSKADSYAQFDRDPNGYVKGSYISDEERTKKRRRRSLCITVICVVLVAFLVGGGFLAYSAAKATMGKPFYCLVLGSDCDENGISRTDTIILARVNPEAGNAALISMPRDLKIELDDYGVCKLNAAYTYGGVELITQAVEELAGVEIPYYAVLDYEALCEVVDILGGVEVDVPVYVTATDDEGVPLWDSAGNVLPDVEPGLQTLDGSQALSLCRSRYYANGDFQRTANQRLLISAVAHTILQAEPLKMYQGIKGVLACVDTNLSSTQLFVCAMLMRDMDLEEDLWTMVAPCYDEWGEVYYLILDEEEWQEMMDDLEDNIKPAAANQDSTADTL